MVKSICWHSGRLRRILYVRRPVMRWQIYRTETSQPALVTRLLKQHTDQNKMTSGDGWHIWWSSSSHWSSWSASFLVAPHPYCQEPNNQTTNCWRLIILIILHGEYSYRNVPVMACNYRTFFIIIFPWQTFVLLSITIELKHTVLTL